MIYPNREHLTRLPSMNHEVCRAAPAVSLHCSLVVHSVCSCYYVGMAYVLCGSGTLFGHTNLDDVYEFDIRMLVFVFPPLS